jgi:putative transposase
MKKSRFSDEQIAHALRQAEAGTPLAEITRKLGVSEATLLLLEEKVRQYGHGRDSRVASAARRQCMTQARRCGSHARQNDAAGRHFKKMLARR